uniref:Ovule protein n=2 Tax=Parascaris univalens TaxID=6257 RepID=A0A915CJG8_PARUN
MLKHRHQILQFHQQLRRLTERRSHLHFHHLLVLEILFLLSTVRQMFLNRYDFIMKYNSTVEQYIYK